MRAAITLLALSSSLLGCGHASSATRGPPAAAADMDGDAVPDMVDRCPSQPEDKDGFEDEDGCADIDNDGDNVPDAVDRCPNDPMVYGSGDPAGADGCPDAMRPPAK